MGIRTIVILLILGTAGVLGTMAYQLAQRPAPAAVAAVLPAPAKVAYLIAARPLPLGTLARADDFATRTVPATQLPANAIVDTPDARANVRGAFIRRYLESGATLTSADFMRPHERGFLAAVLAPNTRAVSIGVNAVSGVAGLVSPGDQVDVILTQEIAPAQGKTGRTVTSETVLSNVRVLAVDQDVTQGGQSSLFANARTATTVTLEATPKEAERLAVAMHLGQLSLAIRSVEDTSPSGGGSVSGADVSSALAKAGGNAGSRVQIIQGDQRAEVIFR
ncbi:MAG TPA: Flp pilus assembly protein CpaB [Rhodopila sp.]|jgi:pilus assembly protein CpaB|nr:Flp pilus assembly protein CpaB [Rhodopila sp.]